MSTDFAMAGLEWRLRSAMAERGHYDIAAFYSTLPREALQLSLSQFTRFVTRLPKRLNTRALEVVCRQLQVEPGELLICLSAAKLSASQSMSPVVSKPRRDRYVKSSAAVVAAPPRTPALPLPKAIP